MRKLLLLTILFISLIYFLIMIYNTITVLSRQPTVPKKELELENEKTLLERASYAIQIPVLTEEIDSFSRLGMKNFVRFLSDNYPEIHNSVDLKVKEITKDIVLYRLKGRDNRLKPLLFILNIAVKDPELKNLPKWTYQPFSGKIEKGFIWGAGSMGDKMNSIALFEALENLLKKNYQTQRTVYIALVKEVDKSYKNHNLLAELLEKEESFEMILGCNAEMYNENALTLNKKIAVIGCSERSVHELEISASKPVTSMNIDKFDNRINWQNPLVKELIASLAPELTFLDKFQMCNYHLFGNLISGKYKNNGILSEMLFEKISLKNISKDNKEQLYSLDYFTLPKEDFEKGKTKIVNFFKSDDIKIKNTFPGFISTVNNSSFEMLQSSIKMTIGDLIVIPGIGSKPTHMSAYRDLSKRIYNFNPVIFDQMEKIRFETGIDERLSLDNYENMIKFYINLLSNAVFG
jgi:carboxypeptidase PM20D1